MDMLEDSQWPIGARVKLGAALIKLLMETACWAHDPDEGVVAWDKRGLQEASRPRAAFIHNVVNNRTSRQGSLTLAPEIFSKVLIGC